MHGFKVEVRIRIDRVRDGGLGAVVRARIGSWVIHYAYESSHKDTSTSMCVSMYTMHATICFFSCLLNHHLMERRLDDVTSCHVLWFFTPFSSKQHAFHFAPEILNCVWAPIKLCFKHWFKLFGSFPTHFIFWNKVDAKSTATWLIFNKKLCMSVAAVFKFLYPECAILFASFFCSRFLFF